eukprot:CAMPEP_0184869280 /NCGR_PEP_ID=MMETSP0580-20130426/33495_1 /TAXON_ID=1118495 /ORGANISM="Dactyliosolen fragilissimus" /LENGTH=209 /DNA_ID=CAMNT_0027370655 /DNA_START=92 /DNA_END=721 /DNA_ORIENTATION=+
MKLSLVTLCSIAATASAFAPSPSFSTKASTSLCMSKEAQISRNEFIQKSILAATSFSLFPSSANAAKYGGFGAGSPEVLDPKTAIVDDEILASEPVQKAFEAVKGYKSSVDSMKSALSANDQADIGPTIRKEFDFVQLRTDLNTLNSAFDEDTQRGTDRIIRIILQDITELEAANKQKPGVSRSEKRLAIMNGKLEKLSSAFSDYLAFV